MRPRPAAVSFRPYCCCQLTLPCPPIPNPNISEEQPRSALRVFLLSHASELANAAGAARCTCTLTLHVLVCIHRTLVSSSLDTAHTNMWSCAHECWRCACMCAPGYVHVLRVGVLASTMHTLPLLSDLLKALKCPSTTGSPGSSTVDCPLHCDTSRASRHRFLTCKVIYSPRLTWLAFVTVSLTLD